MTTALIPETRHHSLVSSSRLSSKASDKHRPESTGKCPTGAESTRKCPGRSPSLKQPVQIKLPLTKADPHHWATQLRKLLRANNGQGWICRGLRPRLVMSSEMVKALRQVMERQNTTLAKAYHLIGQHTLAKIGGGLNWLAITNGFLDDCRSKAGFLLQILSVATGPMPEDA